MFSKLWLFVLFAWSAFAVKVPESTRIDFALKMHRSFCLQSVGQSTAAATLFNDTFRQAMASGIPSKKLIPIGNLFMWYRKYGHYLGLFETYGDQRITDEYWSYVNSSPKMHNNKAEKYKESQEIAEISRDMIFGVAEIIGGLMGVIFMPELASKVGAGFLGADGVTRIWAGFNKLKTKNDAIAKETKLRLKEIEIANDEEFDW